MKETEERPKSPAIDQLFKMLATGIATLSLRLNDKLEQIDDRIARASAELANAISNAASGR